VQTKDDSPKIQSERISLAPLGYVAVVGLFLWFAGTVSTVPPLPLDEPTVDYSRCALREACIGMSQPEVIARVGSPQKINRTVLATDVERQQWVYRDGSTLLYFEGSVMTSFQENQ